MIIIPTIKNNDNNKNNNNNNNNNNDNNINMYFKHIMVKRAL